MTVISRTASILMDTLLMTRVSSLTAPELFLRSEFNIGSNSNKNSRKRRKWQLRCFMNLAYTVCFFYFFFFEKVSQV